MTFKTLTYAPVIAGATFLIGSEFASAADIPAALGIDRVTVYQQGAMVTRAGTVEIPAGSHGLLFANLPATVDAKSLHVAIENSSIRLGGIEVERINEGNFVSEAERELRRQLEQKTDQRATIQDEVATAQLQLKLLDSVAANPAGVATKATVDGANLGAVLTVMGATSANARKRVHDANAKSRELDREIEKLKLDLAKVSTQSKQTTRVHASLEAMASVTATVTLSYRVTAASWNWIYEARLDTATKRLALARQGQVQQGSGENWSNVELTLTTALPSDDVATPSVGSLFVNLQMPRAKAAPFDRSFNSVVPAPAAMAMSGGREALQEVTVTASQARASVAATDYLADYKVPSRITLLADREPRLYPITEDAFAVDLVARVVPSAGRAAHLEAAFKYQRDVPLDTGQLQLYRDGAYVGEANTKAFLPGAEVRMPFGIDDRIRVSIQDEAAKSAERGVLTKQSVQETRRRFDVTSYHPSPISIEVVDRIPVSEHSDVHVDILKGATEPTEKDLDGKAGVFLWRFAAAPQKLVSIRQYYSVDFPKDRQIAETEGDASE